MVNWGESYPKNFKKIRNWPWKSARRTLEVSHGPALASLLVSQARKCRGPLITSAPIPMLGYPPKPENSNKEGHSAYLSEYNTWVKAAKKRVCKGLIWGRSFYKAPRKVFWYMGSGVSLWVHIVRENFCWGICARPGYLRLTLLWKFHDGCDCARIANSTPYGLRRRVAPYNSGCYRRGVRCASLLLVWMLSLHWV